MTRKDALAGLIAKVESGDQYVGMWDASLNNALHPFAPDYARNAYNGSLDAAIALHQAVLPAWEWAIDRDGAIVWIGNPDRHAIENAHPPARAWLIAILKALHAQEAL